MKNYSVIAPSFKGQALIKKYRVEGERLLQNDEVIQDNIINKRSVERLLLTNASVFDSSRRIAISTDSYPVDYERTQVANIIAIGDPSLAGVSGYTFAEKTETTPRAGTYHNRFLTPSSNRTFNTIALVDGTTNNNTANITANAYAYLTLGATVTQEINEIIDIYYKVYIDWLNSPIILNPNFQDELEYLFLSQITSGLLYQNNNSCIEIQSPNNPDYTLRWRATEGDSFSTSYTQRSAYLKREYSGTASFSTDRIWFGITYGRLERNAYNLERYQGTAGVIPIKMPSTLGNVFSHSATANTYFYDGNTLANSSWQPVVTDVENRTNLLPSLYALKVESSGGIGIGTYSIYRTIYSTGAGTSVTSDMRPHPIVVTSKYPYFDDPDNEAGFPYNPKWAYYWTDDTLWVSANEIGEVGIWRIYPQFELVDSWDLTASHSVTKIRDLATDDENQMIYVATMSGLFSINAQSDTITQLSTDNCMAVDVGYSGAVFAVLIDGADVGRLASSLNATWTDAHDTTGASITWENVVFIRCDRTSTDYNLAILQLGFISPDSVGGTYTNRANQFFAYIYWWNNVGNYAGKIDCQVITSTSTYWQRHTLFPYNSSFVCRDGVWVYPKFVYGSNISSGNIRGYPRQVVKMLEARGATVVNSNQELVYFGSVTLPLAIQVGAAFFNQEIRSSTYGSGIQVLNTPSFAILNPDISSGYLRVCLAGYIGYYSLSTSWNNNYLNSTGGCYDYSVDPNNPAILDYRGYRNNGVNTFYFTPYSYGSGASQLYYMGGNVQRARKNGGLLFFCDSSTTSQDYGFAGGNKFTGTHFNPLMISYWGAYNQYVLFGHEQEFSVRYGWNDVTGEWELDPDEILPGKPLHTATEPIIDGLSLNWNNLNPGDSQDLVIDQWYTFTRVPGQYGFIQDGTYGTASFKFSYYLRPTATYFLNTAIPDTPYQLTLDPVTTDALWLSLDPYDGDVIKLNIDGYSESATILLSGTPTANQVAIASSAAGILEFAPDDFGKLVTGDILYLKKIHPTEIL